MIIKSQRAFILHTKNTTYAFRVMENGYLEHLYYGRKIQIGNGSRPDGSASDGRCAVEDAELAPLLEKHVFGPGNTIAYDKEHGAFSLEDVCLEMSAYGKGDIREPMVEIIHGDGGYTSDFRFEKAEISREKIAMETLPCSYDDSGQAEHLTVTLRDAGYGLALELHYHVFEACDVITRRARLINEGVDEISLRRLLSMQIDFSGANFIFTTFNGAWAREMKRTDRPVQPGKLVNASYTGTSSSRANPFVMLSAPTASEDYGECYGFNLIYSGNHYEAAEVNAYGKTRISIGMNPQSFCFLLEKGQAFEAPEAVMTYSHQGWNGMSQNMHHFVREHIVRGVWKHKVRPVLLNSWEASYFDISEGKLLKLAKAGKEVGIELFVMDDGWFGERKDDARSLGDWDPNSKKLPGGLSGLCKKIKALGLDFGIWVEPEMVNVDSRLYKEHPDWVLAIPGRPHAEGRNQRLLDLSKIEVQNFIIEKMTEVFSSADISYVKWDMNRIVSDYYSTRLPAKRQGEVAHRYIMGLYRCMKTLTERFPHILFEGCAAGGNRFDLGILCYFPQIWASDNTDALCRAEIQTGYSYGYPLSVVSAHVSDCPNHQTLRNVPLDTRFSVASFGIFGYECNLCDMKAEARQEVKEQIALYKQWREVLQTGDFYRGRTFSGGTNGASGQNICSPESVLNPSGGSVTEWTCVSKDKKRAVGMLLQKLVVPNTQYQFYQARGLQPDYRYHFYNRKIKHDVKNFGNLVNTVAPIHIKPDSFLYNMVAKFVKMDGENEDCLAFGDTLMYHGVKLKQAFGGTGYNAEVRLFPDFASRLYFMEKDE